MTDRHHRNPQAAKAQIIALIDGHIAELREIGFAHHLTETNATPQEENGAATEKRAPQA
jgi:hypothetical protein